MRKSKLYERYGVKEYWIVDPVEATISIQRLTDGRFMLEDVLGRDHMVRPTLLREFTLDLGLIFSISQEVATQISSEHTATAEAE